ncbi:MAG: alpha/beta fold hydrolase [Actinomycetota bacterium]|nr:alpha/beta fold hydrolase [Actinomycetota bacterium]
MAETSTSTVAVRGVGLECTVRGTGDPAVVWGHGLTSSRATEDDNPYWLLDPGAVAERVRLVRYDARGHGESEASDGPDDYSWRNLALDQLALADALGIDRYVAAGASMGVGTALHAAVEAPERIVALILVIPPTAWETRAAQAGMWGQIADLIGAHGVAAMAASAKDLPVPDPFAGRDDVAAANERHTLAADPVRLARVLRGAGAADLPPRDAVRAIAVPTLILAWTGDPAHPVSTAEQLAELLPDARLSIATTADELGRWTEQALTFLDDIS